MSSSSMFKYGLAVLSAAVMVQEAAILYIFFCEFENSCKKKRSHSRTIHRARVPPERKQHHARLSQRCFLHDCCLVMCFSRPRICLGYRKRMTLIGCYQQPIRFPLECLSSFQLPLPCWPIEVQTSVKIRHPGDNP